MIDRNKTSPAFYVLYIVVAVIVTAVIFEIFLQVVHLKGYTLKGTVVLMSIISRTLATE